MVEISENKIKAIGDILNDPTKPLKARFRALFSLRNILSPVSIECISAGFSDSSALLKHELAYCLGQMQDERAISPLIDVLENEKQEPIVRHEAAEALGAIGSPSVANVLRKHADSKVREIAETCQLALDRLKWLESGQKVDNGCNPYRSVDPAPALDETDLDKLEKLLLDESLSLFERYKAMFALRNVGTSESALILTKGLKTGSALFSHEVAFILGQLKNPVTVPALVNCLEDECMNEMVRHECAEALGAIATQECFSVLEKFLADGKRVVRESCEIALDMCDYESSNEFQYALT